MTDDQKELPDLASDPYDSIPRAPRGLGKQGRELWRGIAGRYSLRYGDELPLLAQAAYCADLIERLRIDVEKGPLAVKGSHGGTVAAPCLQELRQARAQLLALLKQLNLPDEDDPALTGDARPKSERHQRAARKRWANRADSLQADAARAGQ